MREESEFFHGLSDEVWDTEATLSYAMEEMESGFSHTFTSAQVSEFFNRRMNATDSWHNHYLYFMAVRNATDPDILVMHASPELHPVLVS